MNSSDCVAASIVFFIPTFFLHWWNQTHPASIPLGVLHRVLGSAFLPVEASQQDVGLCDQIAVPGKQAALCVFMRQHCHHISPVNAFLPAGAVVSRPLCRLCLKRYGNLKCHIRVLLLQLKHSLCSHDVHAGNQHYRSADVMNTEAVINFTIRYRADVVPGMWVKFRGKKWIISTLGEYGFRRDYLGLKASLSEGVSG